MATAAFQKKNKKKLIDITHIGRLRIDEINWFLIPNRSLLWLLFPTGAMVLPRDCSHRKFRGPILSQRTPFNEPILTPLFNLATWSWRRNTWRKLLFYLLLFWGGFAPSFLFAWIIFPSSFLNLAQFIRNIKPPPFFPFLTSNQNLGSDGLGNC